MLTEDKENPGRRITLSPEEKLLKEVECQAENERQLTLKIQEQGAEKAHKQEVFSLLSKGLTKEEKTKVETFFNNI